MCLSRTFNQTRVTPFGELVSVVEAPGGYNPQGPVSEDRALALRRQRGSERLGSAVKGLASVCAPPSKG